MRHMGDMKQVRTWGPASTRRTRKKLIRHGNLWPELYLPLYKATRKSVNFPAKEYWSAPHHTSVTYVKPVGSGALSPYEWRQKYTLEGRSAVNK
jgi:hypothetical protein